jgi:hypothetical protein
MKMIRRSTAYLAVVAIGMVAAASAQATILSYDAVPDGPSESPANASPGTGFTTVDVDTTANTMHVHIDFSGLSGTTTASLIHSATLIPLTGTAGVATTVPTFVDFPIGVTSGTYDRTLDLTLDSSYNPAFVTANGGTTASAEVALLAGIAAGEAYLNIHTDVFPGGEIRGFLIPVPEPSTETLGVLVFIGLAAWGCRRTRRS